MKLADRVSAFFLAALALALIGYSGVFYVLARGYLYERSDHELRSALDVLAASVETEDDDVKWHPAEHGIDLNDEALRVVRWVVVEENGRVVDHSRWDDGDEHEEQRIRALARTVSLDAGPEIREDGDWRMLQRSLVAPNPKPEFDRDPHEYARLSITVAASQEELQETLLRLGILLCVLPSAVWLVAAGAGRWFVGQAIRPVRAMAAAARSSTQADFSLRLPEEGSGDELTELAVAFNGLLLQLQQAYERQRRFTADAAHQLRTPVTVLLGQIEVALRRPRSAEEYRTTLVTLKEATRDLGDIVETLLFLARHEKHSGIPNLAPVEVSPWLSKAMSRWSSHPRAQDFALEAEPGLTVSATSGLLQQLFDNLITNATQYSDAGTPIVVTAWEEGDQVHTAVRDRGAGIPASDVPHVFEPFYRSDEVRRHGVPGTGLGLAIAARIAEALGGQITCASTLGEGTTFTLSLPRATKAPEPQT